MSKNKSETKKKPVKLKPNVRNSIPYTHVYENGVIETEPGTFTRAYAMPQVDFSIASEEKQLNIFEAYGPFLSLFPAGTTFQIFVQNRQADTRSFLESIKYEPRQDGLNRYRQERNQYMLDMVANNNHNLVQDIQCIVSIKDDDTEHAMSVFHTIDRDIESATSRFAKGAFAKPLTIEERLRTLFAVYNRDDDNVFENMVDEEGVAYFDLYQQYRLGLTSKEAVAPSGFWFKPNHFIVGGAFGRSLFLDKMPNILTTDYMRELMLLPYAMTISIHYVPLNQAKAVKKVRDYMTNLNGEIVKRQKDAATDGYSAAALSPAMYQAQEDASNLMRDITTRDQKLFNATFVLTVFGKDLREVDEATRRVTAIGEKHNAPLRRLIYQQEYGLQASLPLAVNKLAVKRLLTTEAASVFLPFTARELQQKDGICYGINQQTGSLLLFSRASGKNYNSLIFGDSGSGKSGTVKLEVLSRFLKDEKQQIFIIDPDGEYSKLVQKLGGKEIVLAPGSKSFINPFDLEIDLSGKDDSLSLKSDFVASAVEIMCGRSKSLSAKERSVLDRSVRSIYQGYLRHLDELNQSGRMISSDPEAAPTFKTLHNELLTYDTKEAQELAEVIERFVAGSFNTFSHRTNIETNTKLISYNIKQLGRGMKDLGLFICVNDIWNRMMQNHTRGYWTYGFFDEFDTVLRSDSAAQYMAEYWKRGRKFKGAFTGIMQTADELMRSIYTKEILDKTNCFVLLSLSTNDQETLGDLLDLSFAQLAYVDNVPRGTGLLSIGGQVFPFDNRQPSDTLTYDLINTSPID